MPLSLVIDVLLVALFGFLVWRGRRRGFLGAMFSLGRLVLSFLLTVIAGASVSARLDRALIRPRVLASVQVRFSAIADEVSATVSGGAEALAQRIPLVFRPYLDLDRLDPAADVHALADRWAETVSGGISKVIASVVGHILLFALSFALLTVVMRVARGLLRGIGLLRAADQLLGTCLGVVSGVVAVLLLSGVREMIFSAR